VTVLPNLRGSLAVFRFEKAVEPQAHAAERGCHRAGACPAGGTRVCVRATRHRSTRIGVFRTNPQRPSFEPHSRRSRSKLFWVALLYFSSASARVFYEIYPVWFRSRASS